MTNRQLAILTMVGGGLAVVGSLLPWATVSSGFGTVSMAGIEGDGIFALILGAAAALIGFVRYGTPVGWHRWASTVLGILLLLLGASTYTRLGAGLDQSDTVRSSIGVGLYLVILGGVAALLAGAKGKSEDVPPTS